MSGLIVTESNRPSLFFNFAEFSTNYWKFEKIVFRKNKKQKFTEYNRRIDVIAGIISVHRNGPDEGLIFRPMSQNTVLLMFIIQLTTPLQLLHIHSCEAKAETHSSRFCRRRKSKYSSHNLFFGLPNSERWTRYLTKMLDKLIIRWNQIFWMMKRSLKRMRG